MGMAMKDRLRRLLTSTNNKFVRKPMVASPPLSTSPPEETDPTVTTTETCSHHGTDSSSVLSIEEEDEAEVEQQQQQQQQHQAAVNDVVVSASTSSSSYGSASSTLLLVDPYADVRERLEELSLANRKRSGLILSTEDPRDTNGHLCHYHDETFQVPSVDAYLVYLSYGILILLGKWYDTIHLMFQFLRHGVLLLLFSKSKQMKQQNHVSASYAPLLKSWENFYTRHLYSRVQDAFNRPIASNPGRMISVLERASIDDMKTMQVIGTLDESLIDQYQSSPHYTTIDHRDGAAARRCINLGSYNYLGFADDWDQTLCAESVTQCLDHFSPSVSSSRGEFGTTILHEQLERTVADFLNKDDAIVLNMGFNTNATTIPILMTNGDLILSDELNHTSIVAGARASGAAIRVFAHNDMKSLEHALREAVVMGRPRTRRPWNRIWVLVEGIYSMEGEYSDLRNIVRLSKQYGAYIYLDEAHSIGSMGSTGRGVTEYCGVDTAEIDIMMGTFTKSFGGMGGYIASDQAIIDLLREKCAGSTIHNALPPVVCQQVMTAFQIIMGQDGTTIGRQKLQALRDNSNYFRMRLQDIGLHVLGQYDSPVIPVMLFEPGKIMNFTRECWKRGLAVVVVGFPAVPLVMSRARFCVSAAHTRAQIDRAVLELAEVAKICRIRYKLDATNKIKAYH